MNEPKPPTLFEISKQLEVIVAGRFPKVMNLQTPKPLAIGIYKQLSKSFPDLTPEQIKYFLRYWTQREEYLKAMGKPNSERYNLDATVSERVSPENRMFAIVQLTRKREKK